MIAQGLKWGNVLFGHRAWHMVKAILLLLNNNKIITFQGQGEKQECDSYSTFTPNSLKMYGWSTLKRKSKGEGDPEGEIRGKA